MKPLASPWRLLHRRPVAILASLLVLGIAILLYHNAWSTQRLVESKALDDAEHLSKVIAEVRSLYTSEVVEVVRDQGITVTHDYKAHAGAIPLPATFSMLLGKSVGQAGERTLLYSPYPFPWRSDGGLQDAFARDAWTSLSRDPSTAFYRFEVMGERRVLRYATADLMRASCIDCHSSHPDSPKRDWKLNDVRGALEVQLPMGRIEAQTRQGLQSGVLLAIAAGGLGLTLLGLVIGRLRQTTGALEATVGDLQTSHTELHRTHDDLVAARDAALAAVRAKNEFLGAVSHELKTPLNAVIGYSEILREDLTEAGQQRFLPELDKVSEASRTLLTLIDDVIAVSRLDAGDAHSEFSEIDIEDMLLAVAAPLKKETEAAGLTASVEYPSEIGSMVTDERKLRSILRHLLSNAVKFTSRGGVMLRASRESVADAEWIVFDVSDTGIGISSEQRSSMFEPFSQVDSSAKRRYQGLGLGLTIARGYAELMGGKLSVESEPGSGSTFSLRLPVRPPESTPRA